MDDPTLFEVPDELWRRRRCQVCGCALSVTYSHIYVVRRQVWIKIGATNNVRRRINELSRPAWKQHVLYPRGMDWEAPLHTLAVLPGADEHGLHERFLEHHAAGEWFWPSSHLDRWLRDVA